MNVTLPDGTTIQDVPEGTTKEQLLHKLLQRKHPAAQGLLSQMASEQATKGGSTLNVAGFDTGIKTPQWLDRGLAGAGKAVSDMGLGIRQITGNASQAEVDEVKTRDAALMDTGAGMVGNVAGNVAMAVVPGLGAAGVGKAVGAPAVQAAGKYLLSSPATLGGAVTQGGMGAFQSGLQPVATGESRAGNTLIGTAGGAAVPAVGMALKGGKAAVEPLYEGGREQILARALRGAAGQNTDDVISRLSQARELVPGSSPTAAEVAQSGGVAALQRAASAVDPESYATRATQQNEARVAALRGIAGDESTYRAAESARSATTRPMYEHAYATGFDPAGVGVRPELTAALQGLSKRPAVASAAEAAATKAANEGVDIGADSLGSVRGLDYVKRSLGDTMSGAAPDDARILQGIKEKLVSTADQLSPEYAAARTTYESMSKPINQMDVGREFLKKTNALTDNIKPEAYAQALRDADRTAAKATGFSKAKLEDIMTPQQLNTLGSIEADLARSVQARDLGRGAGSDTVQKLAMTNLLDRSGLPMGVLNMPLVGRAGNWAYSAADDKMKDVLAKALLDPKSTASIMQKGAPNKNAEMLAQILRSGATPLGVGGAPALLDAR